MKKGMTEIVFILDRSGSMCGLESDTIGGYNTMLQKQKEAEGEARISTILFDDRYEILHDRIPVEKVSPITDREYYVRGSTALLDAIGRTITWMKGVQRGIPETERAQNVIFIITTDGMENSSEEYSSGLVKEIIGRQQKAHDWQFLFLGANIDAVETAKDIGIRPSHAANHHADARGIRLNYENVSKAVSQFRATSKIEDTWKDDIDKDFKDRSKA